MEQLKRNIEELNALIIQGRPMEAFEKFYHDEVVMQENDLEPTVGKDANRKREEEFFAAVEEFRREEVLDVAIGSSVTMVRWAMDYTHKDWGDRNYTQVSVQHWADGKIIREQFFYGN